MITDLNIHILIVDDEESYRAPLSNYLRNKGYMVDTAADASQALTLLKYTQGKYDIVFVDQVLHGQNVDGVELVSVIKSLFPSITVVVVTGWMSVDKGVDALHNGAYRYISKSAGTQELELLIAIASEIKNRADNASTYTPPQIEDNFPPPTRHSDIRTENTTLASEANQEKELIVTKKRRLRILEQQAAKYGNECPAHIIMEIEDLQREIKDLRKRLL